MYVESAENEKQFFFSVIMELYLQYFWNDNSRKTSSGYGFIRSELFFIIIPKEIDQETGR